VHYGYPDSIARYISQVLWAGVDGDPAECVYLCVCVCVCVCEMLCRIKTWCLIIQC